MLYSGVGLWYDNLAYLRSAEDEVVQLLPGSYLFGMVFLPKQLRQEQWAREKVIINDDEIPLNSEMADIRESEYHESD